MIRAVVTRPVDLPLNSAASITEANGLDTSSLDTLMPALYVLCPVAKAVPAEAESVTIPETMVPPSSPRSAYVVACPT
ncbi:hypothetical protein D3C76_1209930 [compost metagenome]